MKIRLIAAGTRMPGVGRCGRGGYELPAVLDELCAKFFVAAGVADVMCRAGLQDDDCMHRFAPLQLRPEGRA